MRPYLAIITDSFHAAFSSRVLWIVLASIMLFLLVLAPVGYHEVYTVDFTSPDVLDNGRLTGLLADADNRKEPSAAKNVFQALPEDLQTEIRQAAEAGSEDSIRRGRYADALNELAKSDQWFQAELWQGTYRLAELRELDEMDARDMEATLRQRRGRLRLEAAFPGVFQPRPERSLKFTYAWMETPVELAWRHQYFAETMNQFVFPLILNLLLGVGAVFVGVLVTSPIIPEMFQPGSLHLLLSKPVSRPALYLAKFIGGCAFVFVCVTLLVSGLWLIAGMRLGIWNQRFFYTIPVFVFLFAVYYSVSAFAGLHWRSAVVSVVITVIFWFGCFIVVQAGGVADALITGPVTVTAISPQGEKAIAVNRAGSVQYLSKDSPELRMLLMANFGRNFKVLGPVALDNGQVALARTPLRGPGFLPNVETPLQIFNPKNDWKESEGIKLPAGTSKLVAAADGGLLALTFNGVYYAPAEKLYVAEEDSEKEKPKPSGLLAGLQRLMGTKANGFTNIVPPAAAINAPAAFDRIPDSNRIVVYSFGTLTILEPGEKDQPWNIVQSASTPGDSLLAATLGVSNNRLVLARNGEPTRVFSTATLELIAELDIPESASIIDLQISPDGAYALGLSADKRLYQVELGYEPKLSVPAFPRQNHIESFGFDAQQKLWLVHDVDRMTIVDPQSLAVEQAVAPPRDFWRNIDAFVITPLRNIVPQTGEVGEAVVALICGRTVREIQTGDQTQREELNIVRPLATCGAFTFVMLLLGSFYVYRQDF